MATPTPTTTDFEFTPSADTFNVYVRNLPPTITDDSLKGLFAFYGNIVSHRVMVDKKTGQSLCFGFVRYDSKDAATSAIKALNGKDIGGQRLICKFAELPRTEQVRNELNNIYVKPLPVSVDAEALRALFSPFGEITQLTILSNQDGSSRGIGFVRYAKHEDARYAIADMNGKTPPGHIQPLVVKFAETEAEKTIKRNRMPMAPWPNAGMGRGMPGYARGPSFSGRGGAMASVFTGRGPFAGTFGPRAGMVSYPAGYSGEEVATGWSEGAYGPQFAAAYGMEFPVGYEGVIPDGTYAQHFAEGPDRKQLLGQTQVGFQPYPGVAPGAVAAASGTTTTGNADDRNLYIAHLPLEVTDETLGQVFGQLGAVESVKVMMDRNTGRSKGFGFVKFFRPEEARFAMEQMNGQFLGMSRLAISFKRSAN